MNYLIKLISGNEVEIKYLAYLIWFRFINIFIFILFILFIFIFIYINHLFIYIIYQSSLFI